MAYRYMHTQANCWVILKQCPFCVMIPEHQIDVCTLSLKFIEETSSGAEAENCHSEFCIVRAGNSVPTGTSSVLQKSKLDDAEESLNAVFCFQCVKHECTFYS